MSCANLRVHFLLSFLAIEELFIGAFDIHLVNLKVAINMWNAACLL